MTISPTIIALGLAAFGGWSLARRYRQLEGTTLRAVWWWSLGALTVATATVIAIRANSDASLGWRSQWLYLAGTTTFAPLMAQLGAKRPQDRAWQFIVLTLLIVLWLPSAEALIYRPGATLSIHAARGWFLWILIGVGLANGIATRHGWSTILAAIAQIAFLADQLPLLAGRGIASELAGQAAWVGSLSMIPAARGDARSWNRAWRDFRDGFGALWTLRVAERFNAAAQQYGWDVRLGWRGFHRANGTAEHIELDAAMQTTLWGLLRRFVSPAWLRARVDCDVAGPNLD